MRLKMSFTRLKTNSKSPTSLDDGLLANSLQKLNESVKMDTIQQGIDGPFHHVTSVLTGYLGADLADQINNLVKDKEIGLQKMANAIMNTPVIVATLALLNKGSKLGFGSQDPTFWSKMFLTLSSEETGFTFNPDSWFNGTNEYQGHMLPAHAYGLLQLTPAAWTNGVRTFNESAFGKELKSTGLLSDVARNLGARVDQFTQPLLEYGPKFSHMLQVVPNIGQLQFLSKWIRSNFHFDPDKGWLPLDPKALYSPGWLEFKQRYGQILKTEELGLVSLVSIMSANGPGFTKLLQPLSYMNRPEKDVQNYLALSNSDVLPMVNNITEYYSKIFPTARPLNGFKIGLNSPQAKGDPTDTPPVSQKYKGSSHNGIDLKLNEGTPVYAPAAGVVLSSGWDSEYGSGNMIVIKHTDGWRSGYGHMSKLSVKKGDKVLKGTCIGYSGNTGNSTGAHLHFRTVNPQGRTVDPTTSPWKLITLIKP